MEETKQISPVDELVEVAARMKRDHARLRELCRQIADAADPAEGPGLAAAQTARATGRRGGPRKKTSQEASPVVGDKQYWKKVACPVCQVSMGSRVYDGQRYPLLHKDPTTLETCKGSFQAVAE